MLQARRKEFEQMALKVAWWFDIMGRKACRCRGVRGHRPQESFENLDTFLCPLSHLETPSKYFLLTISIRVIVITQDPTMTNRFPFRN